MILKYYYFCITHCFFLLHSRPCGLTQISVRSPMMAKQIEHGPTNLGCFCIRFQCQVPDNPAGHAAMVGHLVPLPLSFGDARAGRK